MTTAGNRSPGPGLLPGRPEMIRAYQNHDTSYDGIFFTAVRTTGVFCRPSCRPPRLPNPENVEFFASVREAVDAGYRPCKLCEPQAIDGRPPEWVARLMTKIEADPSARLKAEDLRSLGISPERARRWFQDNFGMTFTAWLRGRRLGTAYTRIREGADLDDVALGHGFESHSGFREAFARVFDAPPGSAPDGRCLFVTTFESPVGRLLAAATAKGICLLGFHDRNALEDSLQFLRQRFGLPVLPGTNPHLDQLRNELGGYFEGRRNGFQVEIDPCGTPFQKRVWTELRRVPFGETISYQALAARIDRPTAMRAVARANGDNRIAIVVPCHRVIGKDGTLTGYAGGLWRKRLLLELERTGRLPG